MVCANKVCFEGAALSLFRVREGFLSLGLVTLIERISSNHVERSHGNTFRGPVKLILQEPPERANFVKGRNEMARRLVLPCEAKKKADFSETYCG